MIFQGIRTSIAKKPNIFVIFQGKGQGSHRLEKYLNIQVCLEKSMKIKFALKSTEKHLKALKSP